MFMLNGQLLSGNSLGGHSVTQRSTLNFGGQIVPKFLVFHYTACSALDASTAFMRAAGDRSVSAHLLVDVDGSVTQFVPFDRRAWHAGISSWDGYQDLNTHSIGIEVVNLGYLTRTALGVFKASDGATVVLPDNVVEARHKLSHFPWLYWEAYTPAQIATCEALAEVLCSGFNLKDVLGHDDIAPTRKSDPGPAFPLSRIRSHAVGRGGTPLPDEQAAYVIVDKLNIRQGAGAQFSKVAEPLARNTRLKIVNRPDGEWMEVVTDLPTPVRGWVWVAYTGSGVT